MVEKEKIKLLNINDFDIFKVKDIPESYEYSDGVCNKKYNISKNYNQLKNIYDFETGKIDRNIYRAKKLTVMKNWGLATDLLRILILLNYRNGNGNMGDMYIDVDLDIDKAKIGCDKNLCVNVVEGGMSNSSFLVKNCQETDRNLCNHDRKFLFVILTNQLNNLRKLYKNKATYALYLSYPEFWSVATVNATGPGAIPPLDEKYQMYIPENEELKEHTWYRNIEDFYKNYKILMKLIFLYEKDRPIIDVIKDEILYRENYNNYEKIYGKDFNTEYEDVQDRVKERRTKFINRTTKIYKDNAKSILQKRNIKNVKSILKIFTNSIRDQLIVWNENNILNETTNFDDIAFELGKFEFFMPGW